MGALIVQLAVSFVGLVAGFALGVGVLMHVTKGEKLKDIEQDKGKKIGLGLMGWGFAAIGAACGWVWGGALARLLFG